MNLKGYLKEIGVPRLWKNRDEEEMQTWPLVLSVPFVDANGVEREDEIVADHTAINPEYIQRLQQAIERKERMEFQVSFATREYNGKRYQNIKLWNVQILI